MRPGRKAPDNMAPLLYGTAYSLASMRPGRKAPDNPREVPLLPQGRVGFNEAGAQSPG